jgi:hypothetical protein
MGKIDRIGGGNILSRLQEAGKHFAHRVAGPWIPVIHFGACESD